MNEYPHETLEETSEENLSDPPWKANLLRAFRNTGINVPMLLDFETNEETLNDIYTTTEYGFKELLKDINTMRNKKLEITKSKMLSAQGHKPKTLKTPVNVVGLRSNQKPVLQSNVKPISSNKKTLSKLVITPKNTLRDKNMKETARNNLNVKLIPDHEKKTPKTQIFTLSSKNTPASIKTNVKTLDSKKEALSKSQSKKKMPKRTSGRLSLLTAHDKTISFNRNVWKPSRTSLSLLMSKKDSDYESWTDLHSDYSEFEHELQDKDVPRSSAVTITT